MFRTVLAGLFFLFSVVAFAAAFYLLDGMSVISPLVQRAGALWNDLMVRDDSQPGPQEEPTQLILPKEMDESFALRVWQEQVDSQEIIGKLVAGEVGLLEIRKVNELGRQVVLDVRVHMVDGNSGSGHISFERFGPDWYVASATGARSEDDTGMATAIRPASEDTLTTPLPTKEEVDAQLLNTVLAEQRRSQDVIIEYVTGIVKEIEVVSVEKGPRTATLNLIMRETHGTAGAKLVAIRSDKKGKEVWFLARFTKTTSDHPSN